ncbi:M23 family metallopeptidase, partial [Pseudomonas protegens]|uniref:M23 family metallopeptidase n=1 Tax=Pseudomonas protegens TaxID=380021 RepID=UPI0039066865
MLISPPFLPLTAPNESDEEYLNRAMNSTEGAFPLGQNMIWHGGIHLTAPREGNTHLPVRAIADGTVAYVRQPTATNTDTSHPLNYRNGWTDNGCLILKHETDIGEGAHAKVVFYSIYMHLSAIKSVNIAIDMPIYRKDELGTAGRIYGAPHKIHFEVICSQEQLGHFLGRSTGRLTTIKNGRTDSCWGDIHFYIPPEILFYAARPSNPTSATNESAIVHRHIDAYFVSMKYEKGQCTLTTLNESGTRLGERQETRDYEYNLYTTASTLYPRSPSAGYELLRFGRKLGPDLPQPHDAAHWRQVAYPASGAHPAGVGWVNLKSPTVTVYSDADFPHWQGWKLIDDDTDGDGRCQSEKVMELLGVSEMPVTPQQRTAYSAMINTPENQKKLKRLICKFPSEWERANFVNRYNWLSEGNEPIISAQAQ